MIGLISTLWCYPVKSMLGEERRVMDLDARGVRGDRLFAIKNDEGKFGSGKSTRRFRQIDGLFAFRANYSVGIPEITFPDGRCLRGDDPEIHSALSEALGISVALAREDSISHFDRGPVHLVSTGALAWLRSRLPESRVDERRFRPNIVVETSGIEQSELSWIGRTLRIGREVALRVTERTERCRMTILEQSDLPSDPSVLRCVAQDAELKFGVYAEVVTLGRIAAGDVVTLDPAG
jgi:uncharacterized protein YcbX